MVERVPETSEIEGEDLPLDFDLEQIKKLLNDPKYMDTAELEIEKMLKNAKVSLT